MGTDVADALSNLPISSVLCIRLTCAARALPWREFWIYFWIALIFKIIRFLPLTSKKILVDR